MTTTTTSTTTTSNTPTTAQRSLAELVTAHPATARIFEEAGLDYCCHGNVDLATACAAAGLDTDELVRRIDGVAGEADDGDAWSAMGPAELADHIVATHHRYLWDELPSLEQLAAKVHGRHGERHPELAQVLQLTHMLRGELEPHLHKEEAVLFPAIRALAEGDDAVFPFGTIGNPIQMMVAEHDHAGELLAALRHVTGGYVVPDDGCVSYQTLYRRLESIEQDTHVHIHKENNVLFPETLRLESER